MTIPIAVDRPDVMSSSYAFNSPKSSGGTYDNFYINIVAATADLCGLTMNGVFLQPSAFTAVGTSSFSAARFSATQGYGRLNHTNGRPFTAFMYGYDSAILLGTVEGGGTILPSWNAPVNPSSFYVPSFCIPTTQKQTVKTTTAVEATSQGTTPAIAEALVTSTTTKESVSDTVIATTSSNDIQSEWIVDANFTERALQGYEFKNV